MNGTASLSAQITRINPAGSYAKVALVTTDGGELHVDLPFERLKALALKQVNKFMCPQETYASLFPIMKFNKSETITVQEILL